MVSRAEFADLLYAKYWNSPDRNYPEARNLAQRVYWQVRRTKLRRIQADRSPEPYLTVQWAIERAKGIDADRSTMRFEGRPRPVDHRDGKRVIAEGEFKAPLLMAFGAARSASTTLQNLVLEFFESHTPKGPFSGYPYAKDLWYYHKHDNEVLASALEFDVQEVLSLVSLRQPLPALASIVVFFGEAYAGDVAKYADEWEQTARLCLNERASVVPFKVLSDSPLTSVRWVASRTGLEPNHWPDPALTWKQIHDRGTNMDFQTDPNRSNFPNESRRRLLEEATVHVISQLGTQRIEQLEALYSRVMDRLTGEIPTANEP